MKYSVRYSRFAQKDINNLSPSVRKRLKAKLEFYYEQPDPLRFAKKLTDSADAQYRFRIGDYRVLFDLSSKQITILRVRHRREVYRGK